MIHEAVIVDDTLGFEEMDCSRRASPSRRGPAQRFVAEEAGQDLDRSP